MKETLKKIWGKVKWVVGLVVAALVMAAMVFKRDSIGSSIEDARSERDARDEALKRHAEEQERLAKERQEALDWEKKERDALLDAAERDAREEERRLKELARRDEDRFKDELHRHLGVTEKRKDPPD